MLWLKAWLETRWRIVFVLFMSALFFGTVLAIPRNQPTGDPQRLLTVPLAMIALLSLIAAISLAGSGIQTGSARPGASEKGAEGSTLFTLSLPVTRARLFAVRTVTGMLETAALVSLFAAAILRVLPSLAVNAHDALGYFAVLVAASVTVYAISTCLATFLDEGWRFRSSVMALAVLFVLVSTKRLPPSMDIFRPLAGASPLITHQIPWATIMAACVLAALLLAAALRIIQKRDY
ncbi:MAG TPA: hypothetical protein VHY19_06120 [Steroidobacteraceae bacterium]|jgi:hypothetical protein|nr:hypothetical protein [Steroidobacteraceae bacterium]